MRRIFLLVAAVACQTLLMAQAPLEHPKRMIKDSLNRIFAHPSLPQYLFLSTDPAGKDAIRMESAANPTQTNPMHWDGHGVHNFKHQDLVEKTTIVFEIYADGVAPGTTISYGATPAFINRTSGTQFFGPGLSVSLSAKDDMCGLDRIYYSLDGAAYTAYKGPISISEEKAYTLKYYAVDRVGNVENAHTANFTLDKSNPATTIKVNGDRLDDILSPRVSLVLESAETLAGVRQIMWAIDDQPERAYNGPIMMAGLSQGEHSLSYYAIDQVGNREAAQTYKFFLDSSPPIVSDDVIGDRFVVGGREYASGRTKIRLTALDNKAGVQNIFFRLNSEPYQIYKEPFYLPSRAGATSVFAYAVDKANNSNQRDNEGKSIRTLLVDLSGPSLSHEITGPQFRTRDTVFISPASKLALKAVDLESGLNRVTYQRNKGAEQSYSAPISFDKPGVYVIEYAGFDNVENRNASSTFVRVDDKGPSIFPRLSIEPIKTRGDLKVYPAHVVLFLSATDDLAGYDKLYYKINAGAEIAYVNPIGNFERGKEYTVSIRAVDKLGNETREQLRFAID